MIVVHDSSRYLPVANRASNMVPLFRFIKQKFDQSDHWKSLQNTIISLWERVKATKLIAYSDSSSVVAGPGAVGLINISNTCYLNATLQSLASCDDFFVYLENILSVGKRLNIRPRLSSMLLKCLLILRNRESAFIESDHENYSSKHPFNPQNILHEILRHDETFVIGVQQDADELLRKLLEILSEEEARVKHHLASKEIILDDLMNNPLVKSPIPICITNGDNNPFLGLICKQLECCQCHHANQVNHELFTILSLLIPNPKCSGTCTLYDCLDYFIEPEVISDVICNSCSTVETINYVQNKIKRYEPLREKSKEINEEYLNNKTVLDKLVSGYTRGESDLHLVDLDELSQLQRNRHYLQEKRMDTRKHNMLSRLPSLICVGIGRKCYNEHGYQIKLNNHVAFSDTIDITKYVAKYGRKEATLYELASVIAHHGSAQGGHYTNYSIVSGQWFHFSDTVVHEVRKEEVLRAQAYMLFYKRKSNE